MLRYSYIGAVVRLPTTYIVRNMHVDAKIDISAAYHLHIYSTNLFHMLRVGSGACRRNNDSE